MIRLLDRLIDKTAFPDVVSLHSELRKAGFLRIILGAIVFVRFFQIYSTLVQLDQSSDSILLFFGIVLLFTLGFFTQICTILLVLGIRYVDHFANTETLGSSILILLCIVLFLVRSGEYFSLDNLVVRKKNLLSKVILMTNGFLGEVTRKDIKRAFFLGFVWYALISLGALTLHIQDDFWIKGLTIKSLLTNSYLCRSYHSFRWIELNFPNLLSFISILGGVAQSVFQFLMLPLIFFVIGRKFIVIWGFNFFVISLFFINLSYLPHIEIIYWALIFIRLPQTNKKSTQEFNYQDIKLTSKNGNGQRKLLREVSYGVIFLITCLFVLTSFPFISGHVKKLMSNDLLFSRARFLAYKFGLEIPNVFNQTDLSMGDHWMEIRCFDTEKGEWELIPVTGLDGERLNYQSFDFLFFSNHNSDKLYFGNTLKFRREILKKNDYDNYFSTEMNGFNHIKSLIHYDYRYKKRNGKVLYSVIVYKSNASKVRHWEIDSQRFKKTLLFSGNYICSPFDSKLDVTFISN